MEGPWTATTYTPHMWPLQRTVTYIIMREGGERYRRVSTTGLTGLHRYPQQVYTGMYLTYWSFAYLMRKSAPREKRNWTVFVP